MSQYIILLVGKSGTGKSTLAKELKNKYGLKELVSYTDRPMREGEHQFEGHIFVSKEEMDSMLADFEDKIIAKTVFDGYRYCALQEQVANSDIYIIDIEGVKFFTEHYTGKKIPIVIGLDVPGLERRARMLLRGDTEEDVRRRTAYDTEAFKKLDKIAHTVYSNGRDTDITAIADDIYTKFFHEGEGRVVKNINLGNGFDAETYKELKRSCQSVANILQKNYTPHTSVIINSYDFTVKEDVTNGFLKDLEEV